MKKYLLVYLQIFYFIFYSNAQMVYIPDSVFRAALITNYPLLSSCITGDSIDASCNSVVSMTGLSLPDAFINDLTGLEAFQNLRSLFLLNNRLTALPTLPDSLEYLNCVGNQLTRLPALPGSLKYLMCGSNQLDSIPTLPSSLQLLECTSNLLTSIPVLPSTLWRLSCWSNQLSVLPSLPSSLLELLCSNNLLSSLPGLPDSLYSLNCSNNPLTYLPALPKTMDFGLDCSWTLITSIPELPESIYSLVCVDNPSLTCLPRLPVNISYLDFRNSPVSCVPNYVSNQSITIPSLNSIPVCDIFNPSGCDIYWNISGKAYLDNDSNCIQSVNEKGLKNIPFILYENANPIQQTLSMFDGRYTFDTDHFGTYEVMIDTSLLPFDVLCPNSHAYIDTITAMDSIVFNNDFALKCKNGFDVGVFSIQALSFRPGRNTTLNICAGDIAERFGASCASGIGGTITVSLQGNVQYYGPAPGALSPSTVNGNLLTWNISDFGSIRSCTDFNLIVSTNNFATIGSDICVLISVSVPFGDLDTTNNHLVHCFSVVGSFDPNEKQVYPEGSIDSSQSCLTYTINFQNTGTASADNIYILDTLDNSIDPVSFQLLSVSHPAFVQILHNGVLRFNFPNIDLPDSNSNEPLSHGYIQYKVLLRSGLPIGTQISNTAYIYFDFNPPIATNIVNNIIDITNSSANVNGNSGVEIWPVPFQDRINISSANDLISSISVSDITGKKLLVHNTFSNNIVLNTNSLQSGYYILKIESSSGVSIIRIVKQ